MREFCNCPCCRHGAGELTDREYAWYLKGCIEMAASIPKELIEKWKSETATKAERDLYGGEPMEVERDEGLYNCLCRLYGVDKKSPDAQDALVSAAWAAVPKISDDEMLQAIELAKQARIEKYMSEGKMSKEEATALAAKFYEPGNRTVAQMESEQMSKQVKSTHNW